MREVLLSQGSLLRFFEAADDEQQLAAAELLPIVTDEFIGHLEEMLGRVL